jgi:hypothetical protein
VFHVGGTYPSGNVNNFVGEFQRTHFTIRCQADEDTSQASEARLSWRARLCVAILDYRTQRPLLGAECNCPLSPLRVLVRGSIQGRPVREHIPAVSVTKPHKLRTTPASF